ncbi:MAG: hypothetical protein JWP97_2085 [Labilithrix sp.]|nr:hypothetical protein [Labilithrix sp.]
MSWVPAEQVLQTIAAQRQVIAEQEKRIRAFDDYHAAERAKLEAQLQQAQHDLGQALLPRLEPRWIQAAALATGLVGLPAENVLGKLEQRRAWLAAQMTRILHDPRYVNRELLRHPRTGSLMTALAEATEHRRVASELCVACESNPRFARLLETGFGTASAGTAWWRYSYWQDRSAAEEITTRLGKTDFAQVREEYDRMKSTVAVHDAEIASVRAEIAAGEQLDRAYAELYDEHQHLDERALEHTRGRLVQHLLGTDASHVQAMMRAVSSPFLVLFLRASGIAAKISYLDGMKSKQLAELQQELRTQQQRLDQAETKTRKRWAPMPSDRFAKLSEDRRPRYEKRWQRFGKMYTTVHVYDRYERARYYDDLLWWDLMTRGRYDGLYLDDVQRFHHQHPGYQFEPDWKARAAVYSYDDYSAGSSSDFDAVAAASAIETDAGSDLASDVSGPDGGGESGGGGSTDDYGTSGSGGDDLVTTDAS